jgi:hypothetical protein
MVLSTSTTCADTIMLSESNKAHHTKRTRFFILFAFLPFPPQLQSKYKVTFRIIALILKIVKSFLGVF